MSGEEDRMKADTRDIRGVKKRFTKEEVVI